jgi:hypothetical protein
LVTVLGAGAGAARPALAAERPNFQGKNKKKAAA